MKKVVTQESAFALQEQRRFEKLKKDISSEKLTAQIYGRLIRVKRDMVITWLDGVLFVLDRTHADTAGTRALENVYHLMLTTSVDEVLDQLSSIHIDGGPFTL